MMDHERELSQSGLANPPMGKRRWIPCGYGDSRGESKVALPEEVRQHLAEGHLGKFWASDGRLYWIRSARRKQRSK